MTALLRRLRRDVRAEVTEVPARMGTFCYSRRPRMWQEGQTDPALAPGTMVGEYRVEGIVGEGGMGQVYGAIHPVIGKRAAIKVLLPEICRNQQMVERFVMEARAVNQIGHPNIVDVFAFGVLPDGRQYMVMEWLKGVSLSDRLKRGVPTIPETCDVLYAIAAALDAAHAAGIIHRDLKPHNVFLVDVRGAKPLVKLLDFGLVKHNDDNDPRANKTQAGALLGTPAYMSPEQALGRSIDTRSDNYALGVLAFEMLTGRLPFIEDTAMALLVAHMQAPPSLPSSVAPGIPGELDRLVLGLLAKDPNARPTLTQVMQVLAYYRDAQHPSQIPTHPRGIATVIAPQAVPPPHALSTMGQSSGQMLTERHAPKKRTGLYALAALGVVGAAGAAIAVVLSKKPADKPEPAAQPPVVATPADAATVAPPPTPDAATAVVAAPADAAVEVAATPDAATSTVAVDTPKPTPPKKKPPKRPKPDPGTTPPPGGDDDDGLIRVTPKKN
ncbi:MAG TPA: serine/threonine-protein kinase [Kofleriaceae bacterium]|nr:serine/threonine-protein kinase [Kofleriaceae bacterium]